MKSRTNDNIPLLYTWVSKLLYSAEHRSKVKRWLIEGHLCKWFWGKAINVLVIIKNYLFFVFGYKVVCPICGWKGVEFYPLVSFITYRRNSICPRCRSLERHRALFGILSDRNIVKEGTICLEIGPSWFWRDYMAKHKAHYISIDLGLIPADSIMNVEKLGFRNNSFDLILCLHALEFIGNWQMGISELYRVLRPNGILILLETYCFGQTMTIEYEPKKLVTGQPRRRFGEDLPHFLQAIGFTLERYDYTKRNNARGDWFFLCTKQ